MKKNCLITGASSGLGEALAYVYADAGYTVYALARSIDKLEAMAQKVPAIKALPCDVGDAAAIAQVGDTLKAAGVVLDVVILNAGICEYTNPPQFDLASFERTFTVNVHGVVAGCNAWIPLLNPSHATLAIVSSLAHLFPFSRAQSYAASKAAVSYFTDSLRVDLADKPIQISLIEPGFVDTPLTRKNDFSMPFLLPVDQAAQRIFAALERGVWRYRFPRRLSWTLQALSMLPYRLRQKVAVKMASS